MEASKTPPPRTPVPPPSGGVEQVRALFNAKAGGWGRKYAPGGPLAARLTLFAEAMEGFGPAADVLDLGCGTGHLAAHLAGLGHRVEGCDIAERMLSVARASFGESAIRWHRLAPDWERLPSADSSFDAVVSSSVFEYLPDVPRVLGECRRVLRPGGRLLVTVPEPEATLRKVEALLAPVARAVAGAPMPVRLDRYLRYLTLSQNRWPLARWRSMAETAGFDAPAATSPGTPLVLLSLRRR
jgi:ubiquinone/menaquinone biosynthesis C-methylase UbiE